MAMHVGVARVELLLAENGSLKGKRMVVKSVAQRVRNRFNVAVAEVGTQDAWQVATLGIVCVSDDRRHTNEVLSKVLEFIESARLDADVGTVGMELIAVWHLCSTPCWSNSGRSESGPSGCSRCWGWRWVSGSRCATLARSGHTCSGRSRGLCPSACSRRKWRTCSAGGT